MSAKSNGKDKPVVLQVSSVREWHRARVDGVLFQFPSGMVARVRPMSMSAFLKIGSIPDMLTWIVAKMVNGEASIESLPIADYQQTLKIMDAFCVGSFMEPRIVEEITDEANEILIEDVSDIDKQTLFQFIGAPASSLESFRPVTDESLDGLVNSESDGKIPK